MLDENLPTFYLKPGQETHLSTLYLLQHGNEPQPAYSFRYPDPSSPDSKNRYAAALYDPFVPDVVYGEVLIVPAWTQQTLSVEAIRQNGGVAPPPEPIIPSRFTIQLYNPDQQIVVQYKPKTWNTPATWTFEMPQLSFREPTGSTLDRAPIDPAVADLTPKLRFSWRKDSKLSKDLTCLLLGKTSAIPETKTKSKEPDITISIFKALRELTLYEPNLYRVEMEDFKGLEVVLLLGAITIRDVYFSSPKDAFRVSRPSSAAASPTSNSPTTIAPVQNTLPAAPIVIDTTNIPPGPQPPLVESPQLPKQNEQKRKEDERRTKKLLEEEQKARRRRQMEIDKETKRLQKIYGDEEKKARAQTPSLPPQQPALSAPPQPPRPRPAAPAQRYYNHHHHMPPVSHGGVHPYGQLPAQAQASTTTLLAPPRQQSTVNLTLQPKRSSFFGFRRSSDEGKLSKKRSSMFS
ncbi:hypothetical protein P175DRAFT_0553692 [Aspergillus ochraceoroseus IBT 24754]|uniref:Uncharacterized protein n=2 Tax=Aspergillus ochraceoroseus TaxID=138278 RepID=A0A2T5M7A9_9EURO|nr:uncharacterized protein P175DRAFT_0553692 [Aspergillus ochraceoroseus IBT 24754]KKK16965.1 hypothetical protein AOCH_002635 [Aspergillus ochraceoroseus]PTU24412.1 hypothetical protein P175DRAFT_0553692 [Aspergillus ochraceoroseus IBT 24754]